MIPEDDGENMLDTYCEPLPFEVGKTYTIADVDANSGNVTVLAVIERPGLYAIQAENPDGQPFFINIAHVASWREYVEAE